MKLRNIFTALVAAALAFVSCQEEARFLEEFQVSQTMISLPVEGGQFEVTVNATADWSVAENDVWPNVIERYTSDGTDKTTGKVYKKGQIKSSTPSWLSIDVVSGSAGETKVVFSAEATDETRECDVPFACAGYQHTVKVYQMAEKVELPFTSCADVLAANSVGTIYKVKGTITDLTNYDKYGCFYVNDGTAEVYVYGSMNPTQFKPEVGDIISFEGPWTSYGNFDDVTILALEKSLIKLETVLPEGPISLEGGKVTVLLTVKGDGVEVVIPEDAAWITASEPGTIGNMTSFELTAAANEGGARTATVTFKTVSGGKDYVAMVDVEQLGAISAVSVADFLAAAEGTALYELTGVVKNLKNTTYGNFDLVDATGSVYVYGLTGNGAIGSNDKTFSNLGINEGDVITIIGTRASYNGTAQVGGTAYLKEHVVAASVATVAEFLAQPKGTWCMLTGTLSNLKSDVYGNFDLVDETGSVYVYGLTTTYVTKNDKSFANLGLKEGDVVTLVGKRDAYNEQDQVGGPAYYISHVEGTTGDDNTGDDNTGDDNTGDVVAGEYESNVAFGVVEAAYVDGIATVNGVENVATLKLGKSEVYGVATITLPAGTTQVTYYGVAWKNKPSKLEFSVGESVVGTQELAANDGATSNSPYTITVADTDKYTITLGSPLAAETVVTVKTVETGTRAILFGVQAK